MDEKMQSKYIKSKNNPLIRQIQRLAEKRHRLRDRLFFVEGTKFVRDGLVAGWHAEYLLMAESLDIPDFLIETLTNSCCTRHVLRVPDRLYESVTDTESPQGILAVFEYRHFELKDVLQDKRLLLILDCVQDPGNMGTIIRTADAAGFTGVIALQGSVDVYNPKVVRATAGSIFHIPVVTGGNADEIFQKLHESGIRIYAASPGDGHKPYDINLRADAAVVIGNEASGIRDGVLKMSDSTLTLPVPGRAQSLNASVAAGVIMYESVRQRYDSKDTE